MSRYPRANAGVVPPNQRMTYRISEVQNMLGVGRCKIYALIRQGKLQGIKLGGVMLITAASVDKMLRGDAA